MQLKECETCGSHNFTNGKCDYCRNQYEVTDDKEVKEICDDGTEYYSKKEVTKIDFQETPEGKTLLKVMIWALISIIWFAVTVFVPPLFIITIILLVIYGAYRLTKRSK